MLALLPMSLLKKYSAEQAVLLTIAVTAMVVLRALSVAAPFLDTLEELFTRAGVEGTYINVLLRTVASALITRLCADLCRDGGSQTLAALVEITGSIAAMLISMPVLEAVADLLMGYFG